MIRRIHIAIVSLLVAIVLGIPVRTALAQAPNSGEPADAAERAVERAPGDGGEWARLGRLRLRLMDRSGAIEALRRAVSLEPSVEAFLDLALALQLAGDLGGEVSACEEAVELDNDSHPAWVRLAHALARTDRISECVAACERALELGGDAEVADLLERVRGLERRVLPAA